MALIGHSGSHRVQSMHSSGSITRKFGPSWKQSTGHTSTQSVYLHLMQFSVTTKGISRRIRGVRRERGRFRPAPCTRLILDHPPPLRREPLPPVTVAGRRPTGRKEKARLRGPVPEMALPTGFEPVF